MNTTECRGDNGLCQRTLEEEWAAGVDIFAMTRKVTNGLALSNRNLLKLASRTNRRFILSAPKKFNVLCLSIIIGLVAGTVLGPLGTAYGLNAQNSSNAQENVSGSGSAGSGSLAVAMFFTFSASSGAGAFSGTLHASIGYDAGLFRLTVNNPANTPVLLCPRGQVSAGGTIISGSFLGADVLVAGCIGSGVPGAFIVTSKDGNEAFSGKGLGAAALSSSSLRGGIVAASKTSGSGTAGPGTIYTAEADAVTRDGRLVGGGAFVGTISDQPSGNIWSGFSATVQPGCTFTTSGMTASFGSFPNQPVTSSYKLSTCPPTSPGPQDASAQWAVHSEDYVGVGPSRIDPYKNF